MQHRDIKPGNIGFTPEKQARHLLLFDFSLAKLPEHQVSAGTPAYRDPDLPRRGTWDNAADRYAAAATLYEMLTGSRPETVQGASGGFAPRVEAERFDAGLRDRLVGFFSRAFAPTAEQRFASAEVMKTEWLALYAEQEPERAPSRPTQAAALTLDDSVELLDLGTRARNALDRAGVLTLRELLALPRNHLSAIRGVGVKVAKEVVEVANQLRQHLATTTDDGPTCFVPDLRGRPEPLTEHHGLSASDLARLADAALTTTADLAQAPAARVRRLLDPATAAALAANLEALTADHERCPPLQRWAQELLTATRPGHPSPTERHIRLLLGLDRLPDQAGPGKAPGASEPTLDRVAQAMGISRQRVHQGLSRHRERWRAAACCDELQSAVSELIAERGGVAPLSVVAAELACCHGSGAADQPPADELATATALVRITVELRHLAGPTRLLRRRLAGRSWLAGNEEQLNSLAALARQAERLAAADELKSSAEVRERLVAAAANTPLAELPAVDLVRLAASAASNAALSARLELYPPGLAAERALRLSQSVLAMPELKPETLCQRVAERYPQAQPLPPRPELDQLLEPYGLVFYQGRYCRRGVDLPSLSATVNRLSRYTTADLEQRRADTPAAREASRFDDALRSGIEGGRFRVIAVPAHRASQAAQRLVAAHHLQLTSLDHALWRTMEGLMARRNVDPQAVLDADRAGPAGAHWSLLGRVVSTAADELVDALLSDRDQPQLLINPGCLARFDLARPLQHLVESAEHGDGSAIVLLVPTHAREEGAAPAINDHLAIPAAIPGQRLRLPESWLRNAHHAAADEGSP